MSTEPYRLNDGLRRIAEGDQGALRAVYVQTSPGLFALALRFMHSREAAEDVLQETYLTVWRKAGQFNPEKGDGLAWLRAVLRNKALDALRRQPARRMADLPDLDSLIDPAPSALALVEETAVGKQLQHCVGALQLRYARALRSIYFEGLSYPELAEREAVPVATAKSWVQRGLMQIRRSLQQGGSNLHAVAEGVVESAARPPVKVSVSV